jgi:putative ABC transport system permease protein
VTAMKALDRKLIRDVKRMWAQALAVALVMAAGVATLLIGVGAYQSLSETRRAYYDRYQFADIFVTVERAPNAILNELRELPGVARAEIRIVKFALLDIAGYDLPASALVISLPEGGMPLLNSLYLRSGRLPETDQPGEVAVNEGFAKAHGFQSGSTFSAILNGKKHLLAIVGIVLSPEFIYALGPGDLMPDDRRFAIIWMPESSAAAAYDLEGAFSSLSIKFMKGAAEREVIAAVDNLLKPYGGTGGYGRVDQLSHAFIEAELEQLKTMSRILPPIFLVVTAFLINMILTRLITLEREQIGLLKALGYTNLAIAFHYMKFVALIGTLGVLIGFTAGTLLGQGLTRLYAEFFHFPFLIFLMRPSSFAIAGVASLIAIFAGAARAVYGTMKLAPAVAMRPPTPPSYRRFWSGEPMLLRYFSQLSIMIVRYIARWPLRAAATTLGVSLAVALLIASLFPADSVDWMIDVTFHRTDRQDASLVFGYERPARVLEDVAALPGVLRAEPYRTAPVHMRNGQFSKKTAIIGKPQGMELSRVLDLALQPIAMPKTGVVLSEKLAQILHVRQGDMLELQFLEGRRRNVEVPVSQVIQSYLGLMAFMDISALNRLLGEGPVVSGAHLSFDTVESREFFRAIKDIPALAGISLQGVSLQMFRQTIAKNIFLMSSVYVALAVIIAFGVAYNSARIQFSERARELGTLRVLGFTNAEVSRVLLTEFALFTLVAVPVGWALGYGLAYALVLGFDSELYRIPFVIHRATYARASLVVIAAVTLSALIVRRRVDRLDLVKVLKTGD